MGSLRSLRTGHTSYLPRFEVPALTQGTNEEMEIWMKQVWQSKLLETVSKHPAYRKDVRQARTQFGDVTVTIQPTLEQQETWLEELEQRGYVSLSQVTHLIEGLDIYSPKKLTRLERQVIETLAPHRYLQGKTLLKRLKADPKQIEDTVYRLGKLGLVKVRYGIGHAVCCVCPRLHYRSRS